MIVQRMIVLRGGSLMRVRRCVSGPKLHRRALVPGRGARDQRERHDPGQQTMRDAPHSCMVARPAGNRQRVVAALDGQARTFDEKGEGSIAVR